jgi:hypothetical protein
LIKPFRPDFIDNKVIVVDGLVGGGKNLVSSIVSSIPGVEMWLHKPQLEQVCALYSIGELTLEGAQSLLKTWVDEETDNIAMLRNVNFRHVDHSSIFKYPRRWSYLSRYFKEGGQNSLNEFISEKRSMNFMTHAISGDCWPIFEAFGDRLFFIRTARCPMTEYMVNHLANWSSRWGQDPRSGMILVKKEGKANNNTAPYFIKENIEKYFDSSPHDRAIYMLEEWQNKGNETIDNLLKNGKSNILEVPFEKFVFEPLEPIEKISAHLNQSPDKITFKEMKKQKVPRSSLSDAPFNKTYKKIGWVKPKTHFTIEQEFDLSRKKIMENASIEAMQVLDKLTETYIKRYNIF